MHRSRREILALLALGAPAVALGCAARPAPAAAADAPQCRPTEPNIEGPFYRAESPERCDLDRYGHAGQRLRIGGRVLSEDCKTPIAGAQVEVWHADPDGAYDTATKEMRYYGHVVTGEDGAWAFRTVMPGRYLNGRRYRPAHVHVKVFQGGRERLTTQLYFEGDPYIEGDAFVRESLIRPLKTLADGPVAATFDLVLA